MRTRYQVSGCTVIENNKPVANCYNELMAKTIAKLLNDKYYCNCPFPTVDQICGTCDDCEKPIAEIEHWFPQNML